MQDAAHATGSDERRIATLRTDADRRGMRVSLGTDEPRTASPGSTLEQAFVRARLARAPRRRVSASVLETVTQFVPAALALLYEVDEHGTHEAVMALRGPGTAIAATDDLARRLGALEPVDPFSPRRAQALGSVALGADDVGGEDELRRTMFGRHLRRLDLGTPLHAYLWDGSRIVAGIVLLRSACEVSFRRQECALLTRIAPLLADAVVLGRGTVDAQPQELPEERLTERERQVAQLVLAGVSNAEVAARLAMSEATAKTHLTRIYAKLGVRGRTELATQFRRPRNQQP
jgi:DNA-binding CsgD family transcriptional regulator